jgi:putative transposase
MSEIVSLNNKAVCKHCGSTHTRKYGLVEGVQRYFCNDCRHKFSSDDRLFRMKTPANQVSSALDMYYKGMSINDIREYLHLEYNNLPSSKTVYGWITKYTDEAINQYKDYHPQVSDVWVADETVIKLDGKNYWLIDIIDADTRYLLATKLSHDRNKNDIKILMERARDRADKTPEKVLTDGWKGYLDGIEMAFGADSKHIVTIPFNNEGENTELIERWHGTLKDRTKVMRGLKNTDTANQFIDGFIVYYNFLRPHETLDGKTPAEYAKVTYPLKSWTDITRMAKPQTQILITPAKVSFLNKSEPFIRPIAHRNYDKAKIRKQRLERVRMVKQHRVKKGSGITRRSDR